MKRGSSLRFIECPIPLTCALVLGGCIGVLLAQLLGCVLHGLDDVEIAGAAAEVAADGLADLGLARVLGALEQRAARQHHAGRAKAALQPVLLPEAFLDGVELASLLQPLDGRHFAAVGLHRQHGARLHRLPVEQHGARAAVGGVAADVRARQPQPLADEVDQEQPRLDLRLAGAAVHRHLDLVRRHGYRPPARSTDFFNARAASTRAISRLYSTEPRRSAVGELACAALRAASPSAAASGFLPISRLSASAARTGTGPALVSASAARTLSPLDPSVTWAAAAAVA